MSNDNVTPDITPTLEQALYGVALMSNNGLRRDTVVKYLSLISDYPASYKQIGWSTPGAKDGLCGYASYHPMTSLHGELPFGEACRLYTTIVGTSNLGSIFQAANFEMGLDRNYWGVTDNRRSLHKNMMAWLPNFIRVADEAYLWPLCGDLKATGKYQQWVDEQMCAVRFADSVTTKFKALPQVSEYEKVIYAVPTKEEVLSMAAVLSSYPRVASDLSAVLTVDTDSITTDPDAIRAGLCYYMACARSLWRNGDEQSYGKIAYINRWGAMWRLFAEIAPETFKTPSFILGHSEERYEAAQKAAAYLREAAWYF